MRLVAELLGHAIQVGVLGGGPAFTPAVAFQENQISSGAQSLVRVAETLLAVQRHTVERVALPAGRDLTDENVTELLKVAALLEGGRMRGRFDRIALAGETGGELTGMKDAQPVRMDQAVALRLVGQSWELPLTLRYDFASARVIAEGGETVVVPSTEDVFILSLAPTS